MCVSLLYKSCYTWLKVASHLVVRGGSDLICYSCYVLEVSGDPVSSDLTNCLCMLLFPLPPAPREFQLWMSGDSLFFVRGKTEEGEQSFFVTVVERNILVILEKGEPRFKIRGD